MAKNLLGSIDKYMDASNDEKFKKSKKPRVQKRRKEDKRKNYVDLSQVKWEDDED